MQVHSNVQRGPLGRVLVAALVALALGLAAGVPQAARAEEVPPYIPYPVMRSAQGGSFAYYDATNRAYSALAQQAASAGATCINYRISSVQQYGAVGMTGVYYLATAAADCTN